METCTYRCVLDMGCFVLILPMRNGNHHRYHNTAQTNHSSYPTYEEWKPTPIFFRNSLETPFLSYLWGMETCQWKPRVPVLMVFLSYLWGMETRLGVWRIHYYTRFLSYLWGMETKFIGGDGGCLSKFLSYLWGMETSFITKTILYFLSSYPTYEEWKPS